eukprot:TRINITY_DN18205_c0_g1_i1.p1 TRINITY_DN18205_c0_g1~~TRINITY_DN18205_c0_g1_i1.p1  ORF type:complete len:477 (+),score=142.01 TRINITY_DN18205_c0_g1_i1:163-1431(+)
MSKASSGQGQDHMADLQRTASQAQSMMSMSMVGTVRSVGTRSGAIRSTAGASSRGGGGASRSARQQQEINRRREEMRMKRQLEQTRLKSKETLSRIEQTERMMSQVHSDTRDIEIRATTERSQLEEQIRQRETRVRSLERADAAAQSRINKQEADIERLRRRRDVAQLIWVWAFLLQKDNVDFPVDPECIFSHGPPDDSMVTAGVSEIPESLGEVRRWLHAVRSELEHEEQQQLAMERAMQQQRAMEEAWLQSGGLGECPAVSAEDAPRFESSGDTPVSEGPSPEEGALDPAQGPAAAAGGWFAAAPQPPPAGGPATAPAPRPPPAGGGWFTSASTPQQPSVGGWFVPPPRQLSGAGPTGAAEPPGAPPPPPGAALPTTPPFCSPDGMDGETSGRAVTSADIVSGAASEEAPPAGQGPESPA